MEETKSEEGEEASLLSGRNRDGERKEICTCFSWKEEQTAATTARRAGAGTRRAGAGTRQRLASPPPELAAKPYRPIRYVSEHLISSMHGCKEIRPGVLPSFPLGVFFFFKFFLPFNSSKANGVTQYGQTAALSQNNKGKIIIIITFKKKGKITIEL